MILPITQLLLDIGEATRETARDLLLKTPLAVRIHISSSSQSDVIYHMDTAVEAAICDLLESRAEAVGGVKLIAEGLSEHGEQCFPKSFTEEQTAWTVIMDPIDGTRGIMYDKRSAWFLAAAMPRDGRAERLQSLTTGVMVELPTSKAGFGDVFYLDAARRLLAERVHLDSGERSVWQPVPHPAKTIYGGFAQFSKFFPCDLDLTADLEEALMNRLFPNSGDGDVLAFQDQYLSSGGQMAELIAGHDLFIADLRAMLYAHPDYARRKGHACLPYDLCGFLLAEAAGIHLTGMAGEALDAPLDTHSETSWMGYANPAVRAQVEPVLQALLRERGWID